MSNPIDPEKKQIIYNKTIDGVLVTIYAYPDLDYRLTDFVCSDGEVTWSIGENCNAYFISFKHKEGEEIVDFDDDGIMSIERKEYKSRAKHKNSRQQYTIRLGFIRNGSDSPPIEINPYISCN